jgi:thymidylate synthase (FAD)
MKIVKLDVLFPFPDELDGDKILRKLELVARNCYQSEGKIEEDWRCLDWEDDYDCDGKIMHEDGYVCEDRENVCYYRRICNYSAQKLLKNIIKRKHLGILEHHLITVKVICDRGTSHQIVRHRHGSYAQESTRYVKYDELEFIEPLNVYEPNLSYYYRLLDEIQIEMGAELPNDVKKLFFPQALKTSLFMTMNLRSWREFLELRCSKKAHPHIRFIANKILTEFKDNIPVIFDDLEVTE